MHVVQYFRSILAIIMTEPLPISVFSISAGANVKFINNSVTRLGGALYLRSTTMVIHSNVIMKWAIPFNSY